MKIDGQLVWTDYLQAQFLNMRPSMWKRMLLYLIIGVLLVGYASGVYPLVLQQGLPALWFGIIPVVIMVAVIVLYYSVFFPRGVRRIYEQNKEMSAPFEHEITVTGLRSSSQYGNANRPWGNFHKWKENKDLLLLYLSDIQIIILPKRFCTDEQLGAIRSRLQENNVPEVHGAFRN